MDDQDGHIANQASHYSGTALPSENTKLKIRILEQPTHTINIMPKTTRLASDCSKEPQVYRI